MLRFFAATLLVSTLAAQEFASPGGRGPVPYLPTGWFDLVVFGDADNDGDQDVCTNDPYGDFAFQRRTGPHTWTTTGQFPGIIRAAAWADFDNDGDRDLLVGAFSAVGVLRNDGAIFTWQGQIPGALGLAAKQFAVGDVDGDGDLDAVLGAASGLQVLQNNGGALSAGTVVLANINAHPVLFDRDNDGDLDLVAAGPSGLLLWDNAGGVFTNISATLPTNVGTTVVAADLDQDGRVDLALTRGNDLDVLWNDPTGWTFAVAVATGSEELREVLAGDLDGNGAADLVLRRAKDFDWLQNLGSRAFARQPGLRRAGDSFVSALAVADVTGDGALDVACFWNDEHVEVFHGGAPAPFADPAANLDALALRGQGGSVVAIGDVDGDGRRDLVLANAPQVVRHTGLGVLTVTPIVGAREGYQKAWLADLDQDGDLDLLLSFSSIPQPPWQPLQRFTNDGTGTFTPVQDIPLPHSLDEFVCTDIDGDGDVDILSPTGLGEVLLFENLGAAGFVNSGPIPNVQTSSFGRRLVATDLDGDGDSDIIYGRDAGGLPVFLNDGTGGFTTTSTVPLVIGPSGWDLRAVDVDGDGDPDLVSSEAGGMVLYRNSGAAVFTRDNGAFPAVATGINLQVVDIDGDGDIDVYSDGQGTSLRLLRNDGTGAFANATSRLVAPGVQRARFFDFDEDGDEDLVTFATPGLWRVPNRLRDAVSLQTVHPGGAMQVRLDAVAPVAGPGTVMLPIFAFSAGPSTTTVGLAGKFQLPAAGSTLVAVLPAPTGSVTWTLPIPASPGFLGLELCVQGVVLGPNVPQGFTNLVRERIVP